jgi:DNA ligase (NAD+)
MSTTTEAILALVPRECPACGAPTHLNRTRTRLRCTNQECGGKAARRLEVAAKALEMKYFGEAVCAKLAAAGWSSPLDILPEDPSSPGFFLALQEAGLSPGVALRCQQEAEACKRRETPLWRILLAAQAFRVGATRARELAEAFDGLEAVLGAAESEILSRVPGLGEESAKQVYQGLRDTARTARALRRRTAEPQTSSKSKVLDGLKIAVTGNMPGLSRGQLKELIAVNGGRLVSSVSSRTSILLTQDPHSGTSKNKAADKHGVPKMDWAEFRSTYALAGVLGDFESPAEAASVAHLEMEPGDSL